MISRIHILIFFLTGIILACQFDDELVTRNPEFPLSFSNDTISFDTLFTSQGSVTKRLMVSNPNNNAVNIEKIYLGKGNGSAFKIAVGGIYQQEINDQVILGNDSLLILITVTINPNDDLLPFIIKDSLVFLQESNTSDIKLRSWGQNVFFLGDSIISSDQTWTAEKPYLLNASILVDSLITLTIEKGARVYSRFDAFIFIRGTLKVMGTPDHRVVFRNERLEEKYDQVPGQWGGVVFLEGSRDNELDYADIRNVQYGLRIGTPDQDTIPDVILRNVRIENTSIGGIVSFTSDVYAENTLINTSLGFNLANLAGGYYHYDHCTFANYALNFFRQGPSVLFSDNILRDDQSVLTGALEVRLDNSIIWGNRAEEIIIDDAGGEDFSIISRNSIIKTSLNIFEGDRNILETNTDFMQFFNVEGYDYSPDTFSPAIDYGLQSTIEIDLFGHLRDSIPDAGAIELLK